MLAQRLGARNVQFRNRDLWAILAYFMTAFVAVPACAVFTHNQAVGYFAAYHKSAEAVIRPLSRVEQNLLQQTPIRASYEPAAAEPVITPVTPVIPLAALVAGLEDAEANVPKPVASSHTFLAAAAPAVQAPKVRAVQLPQPKVRIAGKSKFKTKSVKVAGLAKTKSRRPSKIAAASKPQISPQRKLGQSLAVQSRNLNNTATPGQLMVVAFLGRDL